MKLHCVASRRHFRPTAFWFSILDSRSCDLGSPTGSQLVSCVEARRSAAFEAPTGLCSIQGAATSTLAVFPDTLHPVRLSSRALATVHWCMSKHPQFWSVSSFFPSFYFFFLEMRLSPSSRSSVRLSRLFVWRLVCQFVYLFVRFFLLLLFIFNKYLTFV